MKKNRPRQDIRAGAPGCRNMAVNRWRPPAQLAHPCCCTTYRCSSNIRNICDLIIIYCKLLNVNRDLTNGVYLEGCAVHFL